MVINLSQVQPFLVVLLPLIMPYLGDFAASVLAQDGFPQVVNDILAWLLLIVTTVASGIASGALIAPIASADWTAVIGVLVSVATALCAGPLTNLKPWVNFTALVQSRVFNVLPAFLQLFAPPVRPVQQQPPVSRISQAVQPPARPQPVPQPIVLPPAKAQAVQPMAASAATQVPQVAFPVPQPPNSYTPPAYSGTSTIDFGTTGVTPIVPGK